MQVALHTRLKPGAEEAYEAAHRDATAELLERVHNCLEDADPTRLSPHGRLRE